MQAGTNPERALVALVIAVVGLVLAWPRPGAAVDLAGHWWVEAPVGGPLPFVEVTQSDSTVTMELAPGITVSGSIGGPGSFTLRNGADEYQGRLLPDATVMDGRLVTLGFAVLPRFVLSRCECFDGNTTDGDGCDASCRVEECFTCAGDPSVCTPSAESAACDDRHDCTTGETCTAGSCGGGTPVPGCVDLEGVWRVLTEIEGLGSSEADDLVTQRQGVVRFPAAGLLGTIDPATGVFELAAPVRGLTALVHCPSIRFDFLNGTATTTAFTAIGAGTVLTPMSCNQFGVRLTGTRQDERCFTCTGEPPVCAPNPGASCDDGNTCTTGDTCGAGGACVGSAVANGASCDTDGDVCNGLASCQAGACQPAPPQACSACERCDVIAGCVTAPRLTCTAATNPKRTTLAIRNHPIDERDTIAFRWKYGPGAAAEVFFGDPGNTDDYGLCIFDESTPAPALVFRAVAPAGGTCGGRACWGGPLTAPSYRDKEATPDGLTALRLKGGADRAKASLKGKGGLLSSRPLGLPGLPLPLPLLVQLQNVRGACVEARFDAAGVTRNDPMKGRFKASATP